jgi:hypothetical protein
VVKLSFARQQSVPEQPPGALERPPLLKRSIVRRQYVFDVLRIADHKEVLRTRSEVRNVTEARHRHQECKRVAPERKDGAAGNQAFRPGWEGFDHSRFYITEFAEAQ